MRKSPTAHWTAILILGIGVSLLASCMSKNTPPEVTSRSRNLTAGSAPRP